MSATDLGPTDRVIGELDGEPIVGSYCDDTVCDGVNWGKPYDIIFVWNGIKISMDDRSFSLSGVNWHNLSLADFGRLREFITSGVVERLLPIARQFVAGPRLDVPMPEEHAPADDQQPDGADALTAWLSQQMRRAA